MQHKFHLGKNPCPRCRAAGNDKNGDNFTWYGEEKGGYCFSCGYFLPSKKEQYEEDEQEIQVVGLEFNEEVNEEIKAKTGIDPRGCRGIREDVAKWLGVRFQYNMESGEVEKTFYPVTKNYKLSGYKVREHPKTFKGSFGETGKDCDLFGQFRFRTLSGTVVIVEGEEDMMAAYQMLKDAQRNKQYDPPAVVSTTIGASGAYKQVQQQYEFFNQFKKIIVCMDSDEAGNAGRDSIIEVLPRGKIFVMDMRHKDASEYLQKGAAQEFISDYWNSRPYVPSGVKSAADGMDEIKAELSKPRITLPPYMHVMQEMMGGGVIQGRIGNIIAYTSTGKSAHMNRMVYHWIFNSPVKPTIVSLEATAAQYSIDMLSIHLKNNLMWNLSEREIIQFLDTKEGQEAMREVSFDENGQPRYFMLDERTGGIHDAEAQMELLWKKFGSKLFVIDVLSDLLRGSSAELAEDHMKWQRQMAKNGVTMMNVMHTKKPEKTKEGGYKPADEYDALGTGSFVQSGAYNIVLNRDKLSDDFIVRNTTFATLSKCRGGQTGDAGKWFYDFNTATCYDLDDYMQEQRKLTGKDEGDPDY